MKAIAGVFASTIMFAMLFTAGIGYFIYVDQGALSSLAAQRARNQALSQASSEMLSIKVGLSALSDPWGYKSDLWLRITNTGEAPSTLLEIFVVDTITGTIASASQVTPGSQFLSLRGTASQKGDLNVSLPLTIPPGMSTAQMASCGAAVGCDISISRAAFNFSKYNPPHPVEVSVVTANGNTFSAQYPPPPTTTVSTTTSATTTAVTTTVTGGNPGGAILVAQMVATPPQTFACGHCVNDTVTVYNYGTYGVTGVSLSPSVPTIQSTGTLIVLSKGACVLKGGSNSLPAYSGSGPVPSIVYVCTFSANPNGFGGFASFSGSATGTYNGLPTTSGVALSNTIQIGGPVNVLNQGPFSPNFFYFKYSACTTLPTGSTPCKTTPSPVTISTLPTASLLTGSSSYYVAFYVQITNNYNITLPILPYTYFLTDPTQGGETPFYIVGNPSSLPYVPNYNPGGNNVPTLTPYPSSCTLAATSTCINLAPGSTVTLTFAACDITSTYWDWAGSAYGKQFDSGNNCTTNPPAYVQNEATWIDIVVSFVYKGQVYDQGIPFMGMKVN
jgi:hypothetical protein